MEKSPPALAALGLITCIRQLWRRRARDRIAANAANHAPRPENFAGKWPDADAVLAWRLSATTEPGLRNPGADSNDAATVQKQETP